MPGDTLRQLWVGREYPLRTSGLYDFWDNGSVFEEGAKALKSETAEIDFGGVTIPRLRIIFECEECNARWRLSEEGVTVDYRIQVLLNSAFFSDPLVRNISMNAEAEHVQHFRLWAQNDGREVANSCERRASNLWNWTKSGCEENVFNQFKELSSSLNTAGIESWKLLDQPNEIGVTKHALPLQALRNQDDWLARENHLNRVPSEYLAPANEEMTKMAPAGSLNIKIDESMKTKAIYSLY